MERIATGSSVKVADLTARRKLGERAKYAAAVLAAWDKQSPAEKQAKRVGKPSTLDTNEDVRRRAKSLL